MRLRIENRIYQTAQGGGGGLGYVPDSKPFDPGKTNSREYTATQNSMKFNSAAPLWRNYVTSEKQVKWNNSNDDNFAQNFLYGTNTYLDYTASLLQEDLGRATIGNNGKLYYKAVFGGRGFYGNQSTKVIKLANVGKYLGWVTLGGSLLIEYIEWDDGNISGGRAIIDVLVLGISAITGGYAGLLTGIAYQGIMYEYQDRLIPYNTVYLTGNIGMFPADNSKVRKIKKIKRKRR